MADAAGVDYTRFAYRFRGAEDEIRRSLEVYRPYFADRQDVLDIGCGRGEFLEVLGRWKVDGYGVEIDAGLVEECRARGLRATLVEDGLAHLAGLPDESLGGLVLLQVIEHLSPQQQLDLIALAFRKLKFGGRFVVETLNASSLYVYANAMYLDPTHTRPVHPAYLGFLCEEIGFEAVEFEYRSPVPDSARLLVTGPADATPATAARKSQPSTRALEKLDALLHAPQDYLVVATK